MLAHQQRQRHVLAWQRWQMVGSQVAPTLLDNLCTSHIHM